MIFDADEFCLQTAKTPEEVLEIITNNIDNSLSIGYLFDPAYSPEFLHGSVRGNKFAVHKDYPFQRKFSPTLKGVVKDENGTTKIYISVENPLPIFLLISMFPIIFVINVAKFSLGFALFCLFIALVSGYFNVYIFFSSKRKTLQYLLELISAEKI